MAMEKAMIINTDNAGQKFEVMYNPPSLNITSSNSYADMNTPGGNQEKQQYIKGNSDVLSVELFFDTTRSGKNVRDEVDPILDLGRVTKGAKEPPKLKFAWGAYTFDCVILSIDHTYDYFNSSGQALRASLKIKFQRIEPAGASANTSLSSSLFDVVKTEVLKVGQDLTGLCDVPTDWRKIAELNNIDNPLLVCAGDMVGQVIKLI